MWAKTADSMRAPDAVDASPRWKAVCCVENLASAQAHFGEKFQAEPRHTLFVAVSRTFQLRFRFGLDVEPSGHRD
ncbi:MAG TPA: hypothetical protein VNW92_01220 [Polyangiaceae bacterium]|jgi:hypothetical protein|nr:hypothetical protein [Polyangiaceae bacterium]